MHRFVPPLSILLCFALVSASAAADEWTGTATTGGFTVTLAPVNSLTLDSTYTLSFSGDDPTGVGDACAPDRPRDFAVTISSLTRLDAQTVEIVGAERHMDLALVPTYTLTLGDADGQVECAVPGIAQTKIFPIHRRSPVPVTPPDPREGAPEAPVLQPMLPMLPGPEIPHPPR